MTDAPEYSGHDGAADLTLTADNGRHCDDVIGIGGMAHSEEEAEDEDREERHREFLSRSPR